MIENFSFGCLCVIGDVLLDQYVFGSANRISPEAPVPVLLHSHRRAVPGGAANVAANAAALGCRVNLVGVVGTDHAADTLREAMAPWKSVSLRGLVEDPVWTTITKTRILSGQQQIMRLDEERVDVLSPETPDRLIAAGLAALADADVLVCSDYAKGALSDRVLAAMIGAAREKGIPVIVDPKRKTFEAYRGANLITPNRSEMARATGLPLNTDTEIETAARAASEQFGGDVLLTRSEAGMTLWRRNGESLHAVARRSEVCDVSGAGDTVVATVASVLSAGEMLETAVVLAATAAAVSVSKLGTAVVTREELSRELHSTMSDAGQLATIDEAKEIVRNWRQHGAQIVFTNGCFDLIHPGHIGLIRAAAREGDKLIVALNTDSSVRRLKGESRPIQDEIARATVMGALRDVDLVVLFDEDTPLETIMALRPNVVVKGADYTEDQVVGGDFVKQYGGRVALVDILEGRSTSSLVKKAREHDAHNAPNENTAVFSG
ncbi:D-glycero-beta-D-manno-heptose-7-phosphate kinase [Komagataeibacter sp. FNDCR2]|uniref:D-glycero-beta-D-manno-heptose-7-phosphate kinase n=1 Tax=Komagataeibacter sp. FNDCR2 TaxID=2878682 RepID=UPI001E4B286E|nr:D-glycero-beta-D-manno-heptose-7-phosphate kinase [Komagataeibacter sp. FNDCR2]MCE2574440.1 D-glycero-beta-D-manno-heptose-7-phosphate kinase [Komagataeibacter sp. FNDCR2]